MIGYGLGSAIPAAGLVRLCCLAAYVTDYLRRATAARAGVRPNVHQISPPAVVTASNGRIPPPLFRRHLYRYGVRANGLGG